MRNNIIEIKNLSKVYKLYDNPKDRFKEALSFKRVSYHNKYYALNDVSFNIKKGENIGLIGTNGSGKSTILKIIAGVLSPNTGSIQVAGKVSALLELGAGFNMEYTGIENIHLNATIMGYSIEETEKKLMSIVEFADIGDFIYQPVKNYSSGMFARLAFAVAISADPDILIVDEALSVGDIQFQLKCLDKMKQMIEGGTTVIFVSHDLSAIRRFCTRAVWLNRGKVILEGDVNRVADKYMEFLNSGEAEPVKINEIIDTQDSKIKSEFVHKDIIAEIVDIELIDESNKSKKNFYYDEYLKVKVVYNVYDDSIINPVLGIAAMKCNGEYFCGVNTLLDKIGIPWNYGRNVFYLEYAQGLRAIGGDYYFDVALFDQTATAQIQYITRIMDFTIISEYKGEGKCVIPHSWKEQ